MYSLTENMAAVIEEELRSAQATAARAAELLRLLDVDPG